jgi:hypothetical protein
LKQDKGLKMKTYAHIDVDNNIVGIGIIYYESGELTNGMKAFIADSGLATDAGIVAYGQSVAPEGVTSVLADTTDMPGDNPNEYDKTFRGAFKKGPNLSIDVSMPMAKDIAHNKRRVKRDAQYSSVDGGSMYSQLSIAGQTKRDAIKMQDDKMQISIDGDLDDAELKQLMIDNSLI